MDLRDEDVDLLDDEMWMETGDGAIPVSQYWPYDVQLAVRLFNTEYEYGSIHFRNPYGPERAGIDKPGVMGATVHEMNVVFHPSRGALLVGSLYPDERTDPSSLLDREYDRLCEDRQLLMESLMEPIPSEQSPHPYWSALDIAIGPAILMFGETTSDAFEGSIPECLIEVDDWGDIPDQLGRLMDRYEAKSESAYADYGAHLRAAIQSCQGFDGGYLNNVAALQGFDAIASWLWSPDKILEDINTRTDD